MSKSLAVADCGPAMQAAAASFFSRLHATKEQGRGKPNPLIYKEKLFLAWTWRSDIRTRGHLRVRISEWRAPDAVAL